MKPAWRKRLLEEWRGVPHQELPKNTSKVVGDVVPGLMKKLGLSDRFDEDEMKRAWMQAVGHPLCLQSVPEKIAHQVLHVRMIQPTIHFVLEDMREEILGKLQERFGKQRIKDIKFILR